MSRWLWQWLRLPGWPVLPRRLWLALSGLVFCISNELFKKELWPHTPAAERCFLAGAWLLVVGALPQLLWVGWRWLLAWQGPSLLRCLAYGGVSGRGRRERNTVAVAGNNRAA